MAIFHSTDRPPVGAPPFLLSRPVPPVCVCSAAEAYRLSIADQLHALIVQRTEALAELRRAGSDIKRLRAAARREAELTVQIRRLRSEGGAA